MIVWRLSSARYADEPLSGVGGLYVSGRWHFRGTRLVYTSRSLALASVEVLVHHEIGHPPKDMVQVRIEIPDDVSIETVTDPTSEVGPRWNTIPASRDSQAFGTRWCEELRSCALIVPSVVVEGEENVLLNPAHPEFGRVRVIDKEPFAYDRRLRAIEHGLD